MCRFCGAGCLPIIPAPGAFERFAPCTTTDMDTPVLRTLQAAAYNIACSGCSLRETCLPVSLTAGELKHIDGRMVAVRRKVARGETLYLSLIHI